LKHYLLLLRVPKVKIDQIVKEAGSKRSVWRESREVKEIIVSTALGGVGKEVPLLRPLFVFPNISVSTIFVWLHGMKTTMLSLDGVCAWI